MPFLATAFGSDVSARLLDVRQLLTLLCDGHLVVKQKRAAIIITGGRIFTGKQKAREGENNKAPTTKEPTPLPKLR